MVTRDLIAAVTHGLSADRKLFDATTEATYEAMRHNSQFNQVVNRH